MGIEMIDETGMLRSNQDIQDAIMAAKVAMIKHFLDLPPELSVMLPTIVNGLEELLARRRIST